MGPSEMNTATEKACKKMTTEVSELDVALAPCPDGTGVFRATRSVWLGDTDDQGRLRLDAVARYLMELAYEHLETVEDGHLHRAWVVKRTVIDMHRPIRFGERIRLRRWPSATSNRWCSMRVDIDSDSGGLISTDTFVINVDPMDGRPTRMTDRFLAPMLSMTTEHRLRWRPALRERAALDSPPTPFPLRFADLDLNRHVNYAIHWQAVEEALAQRPEVHDQPYRAIVEHVGPILAGDHVTMRRESTDTGLFLQLEVDGAAKTLASVHRLTD